LRIKVAVYTASVWKNLVKESWEIHSLLLDIDWPYLIFLKEKVIAWDTCIHTYIYVCMYVYVYIYYIKYYRYFDVFIDIFYTKLSIISADCKLYDDYIDNDIMNEINIKLTIH